MFVFQVSPGFVAFVESSSASRPKDKWICLSYLAFHLQLLHNIHHGFDNKTAEKPFYFTDLARFCHVQNYHSHETRKSAI